MIDLFIEQNAALFVKTHNELLRENFPYKLDYTWDSINVIDFITQESLGIKQSNEDLAKKILGLSCYLSICMYNIWKVICKDSKISLVYSQKEGSEALLKMENGIYVNNSFIKIDFFEVTLKTLKMQLDKIEYTKGIFIPLGLEGNRFSYIMNGILMGISPFIKGGWEEVTEKELSLYLHEVSNLLSLNKLTSLKLKYPAKDNIIKEDIFNPHLVLPPLGYKDQFIGSRIAFKLAQSIKNLSLDKTEIIELSLILLESPSILEASMGYLILGAYNDHGTFNDTLSEFSITYPILSGQLKPAFELFCKEILEQPSWQELSKASKVREANIRLKKEIEMGINPLVFSNDLEIIHDKTFRPYFECIDKYLIKEAFTLGSNLITLNDCPQSLKIQHAWLALECNAPNISIECLGSLDQKKLSQEELLRLKFINIIIDPRLIDLDFNSVKEILANKDISLLHKKQFALICAAFLNNSNNKDLLIKLFLDNPEILSLPLMRIVKKHIGSIDLPKKTRKAYWSKYNALKQ